MPPRHLRHPLPLLTLALVCAGAACGGAAQVEVVTRVGEAPAPAFADDLVTRALLLRADREREVGDPALETLLGAVPPAIDG